MNQRQVGGTLVPVAEWRRSSYSEGINNCVEVSARVAGFVRLRDSKHPGGGLLAVTHLQWRALLDLVR